MFQTYNNGREEFNLVVDDENDTMPLMEKDTAGNVYN